MVKPVQSPNAYEPMLVTVSGIVMLVRLVQPLKAYAPIVFNDDEMLMPFNAVAFKNALAELVPALIVVIVSGMAT